MIKSKTDKNKVQDKKQYTNNNNIFQNIRINIYDKIRNNFKMFSYKPGFVVMKGGTNIKLQKNN